MRKGEGLSLAFLSILIALVTVVIFIALALSTSEIQGLTFCCRRCFSPRQGDVKQGASIGYSVRGCVAAGQDESQVSILLAHQQQEMEVSAPAHQHTNLRAQ